MKLDPEAAALLEASRRGGARPVHRMTVGEARRAAWSFKLLCGVPERVARVRHLLLPGPHAAIRARAYYPTGARPGPKPALVYFHGGGFVVGNIEICDSFSRALANRSGCVVIAVNYRKAPEHRFPAGFDDCYRATEWVFRHAQTLGIDRRRIGVAGDSAGGNLAAAVALKARDTDGPKLALQLLLYPAVGSGSDTPSAEQFGDGLGLDQADIDYFRRQYLARPSDATNPYCSPVLAASHANLPRALVVCGTCDPLLDDSLAYTEKLRASGVPVELRLSEGMIHGFLWMLGRLGGARRALNDIGREVRRMLHEPRVLPVATLAGRAAGQGRDDRWPG